MNILISSSIYTKTPSTQRVILHHSIGNSVSISYGKWGHFCLSYFFPYFLSHNYEDKRYKMTFYVSIFYFKFLRCILFKFALAMVHGFC